MPKVAPHKDGMFAGLFEAGRQHGFAQGAVVGFLTAIAAIFFSLWITGVHL